MVEECEAKAVELPTSVQWVEALAEVQARVAPRFPTAKVRAGCSMPGRATRARRARAGLLRHYPSECRGAAGCRPSNGWRVASSEVSAMRTASCASSGNSLRSPTCH